MQALRFSSFSLEKSMAALPESSESHYVSPAVVDLGDIREFTLGSSGSGSADANSQYYWA